MSFYVIQFLNGLVAASSLFLVAAGLSIIFGVTRIVNFAHGSFYMLGAYIAYSLIEAAPPGALGFWGGDIGLAMEAIGIGHLAPVPVRLLSSGQAKRATLARVAAADAPLWLLDEPLNALDPDGVERLSSMIAAQRTT